MLHCVRQRPHAENSALILAFDVALCGAVTVGAGAGAAAAAGDDTRIVIGAATGTVAANASV